MKFNLAAPPKEEAWRIFHAAIVQGVMHSSACVADMVEESVLQMGVMPPSDQDGTFRILFERWYAREIGGGA